METSSWLELETLTFLVKGLHPLKSGNQSIVQDECVFGGTPPPHPEKDIWIRAWNLTIKPIPGTFKLHQIVVRDQSLVCKQLSCECNNVCENCENSSKEVALKPSKQNKTCSNTKTTPSLCRGKKMKQIEDMNLKDADSQKVKKALKNKSPDNGL